MGFACCGCQCGSTESLLRNFLKRYGCPYWLKIDIPKGRERSLEALNRVPQFPEVQDIRRYLQSSSKWAVVIGWDESAMRWADISHGGAKAEVDASFIVKIFS